MKRLYVFFYIISIILGCVCIYTIIGDIMFPEKYITTTVSFGVIIHFILYGLPSIVMLLLGKIMKNKFNKKQNPK